jgi:uncharacterized protein
VVPRIEGTSEQALTRVREQARLQLQGREERRRVYELLLPAPGEPIGPERGLATLPEPSRGDLFFDIEGDPYAFEDGLDYLFGVLDTDGTFHAIWSRETDGTFSLAAEQRAFEQFIDFVMARLAVDPKLHVYHYAPYEPTALKRLMGRYGTRETEVDQLLRGGVLVDLLRAVRQGVRASVESYSIKKMEQFYGFERDVDLRDAGSSIVAFEQWLELSDTDRPAAEHLDRIERYNRDDVISNARLRDWLEERRIELASLTGLEVPRPGPREGEASVELTEAQARVEALAARLTEDVPSDSLDRSDEQHARWLLAQLLGWHRREDKSEWWEFHRLMDLNAEQLVDESVPIGQLEPLEPVGPPEKGKQVWRYRFPAQDYDVGGGDLYDPALKAADPGAKPSAWKTAELVKIDDAARTIELRGSATNPLPHPAAVVPLTVFMTTYHRAALERLGTWVAEHGIDADGPYRAIRDLLLNRPPRTSTPEGQPLRRDGETDLEAALRLAVELDRTVLPIQGPPGSGKTYSGARMICRLLAEGRRVGITANSHKVIGNLLKAVYKAAGDEVPVRVVQRGDEEQLLDDPRVKRAKDPASARAQLDAGLANLAAGTSWLWVSEAMAGSVDVLFVDEAGQVSLANVVAMAAAARSFVLLGDPQQLDQPLRGSHPPGADRSALAHVLRGEATIAPDRGLFLEKTWRLHPELTRFTSEVFYDGRLESQPHLARQRLDAPDEIGGVGLRLLPVPSEGFDSDSPVEADAVADLARRLVERGRWTDEDGVERRLTWEDVLIVAPYNAQVGAIKRRLPVEARVGTVDKFQGQEAPISLYSMTTSSPELAPRGLDFLFSRNRLNVATSRARCVTVTLASPALLQVRARTPAQMWLANALCRFAELAAPTPGVDADPAPDHTTVEDDSTAPLSLGLV